MDQVLGWTDDSNAIEVDGREGDYVAGILLKAGGTFNNTDTITGQYYGLEIYGGTGTVLNTGSISATSATGYGILLKDGGSIANNAGGYIGGATAISLLDGGTVTNAAGATINSKSSSGNAVAVNVEGAAGTVSNSGSIVANSATSKFAAIFLGDGGSVTNTSTGEIAAGVYEGAISIKGNGGQVTNAGTISANSSAVALAADAILANTGRIYGGVTLADGGTVTNSGTISAAGKAAGVGMTLGAGAMVTNQAGGTIYGGGPSGYGISVYGGGAVVNAGTIGGKKGALQFTGTGANTLTLQTGSLMKGAVVGSAAQGASNALVLTGSGAANNAFLDFNTLSMSSSGTWTLGGVSAIGATTVSAGALAITGKLTTSLDQTAASIATIGQSGKLKLDDLSTLGGTIAGLGSLVMLGGSTTLASGAELTVRNWTIRGSGAKATLGEALTYGGNFTAGSGAVVTISDGPLLLTGTATFSGSKVSGTDRLKDRATTSITGLIIGGTGGFANKGVTTQTGAVTLGDARGDATLLFNTAIGTWDIGSGSDISLGASMASYILNSGLFEQTGPGVSVISPGLTNDGAVLVSAGALDFASAVSGTGSDTISGAATLEFDQSVAATQTIDFTGAGGVLDLGSPSEFSGAISGYGAGDAVSLLGSWSISGFSRTSASQGVLTLSNAGQSASLTFDGNYSQSLFDVASSAGHTTITYT